MIFSISLSCWFNLLLPILTVLNFNSNFLWFFSIFSNLFFFGIDVIKISFGVNEIIEIYTFNRTQMIYQIWRIKTILWIFILFSSFRSKITYFYFCLSSALTFPSFPEYAFYLSNFFPNFPCVFICFSPWSPIVLFVFQMFYREESM